MEQAHARGLPLGTLNGLSLANVMKLRIPMHQMPTPLTHHASPTGFPIGTASSSFGSKTPLMTISADEVHPRPPTLTPLKRKVSF